MRPTLLALLALACGGQARPSDDDTTRSGGDARVILSDGEAPFEAILEEDGRLRLSLSPGEYTVSAADSSTGQCLVAQPVETAVVACEQMDIALSFEEVLGC